MIQLREKGKKALTENNNNYIAEKKNHCLIIGYGNTARRDDGAGIIAVLSLPGNFPVDSLIQQELGLELIETVSSYKLVIFVDSSIEENVPDIYLKKISLENRGPGFSHTLSPSTILTLAKQLYGSSTQGYIMSIKGYDFDLGEGLSPMTERLTRQATEMVINLVENWSG